MNKTLIFIISIAFIISCKPDPPYYKLYPETREWDCYKLNSWWVYKNTETGVLDCLWVKKRREEVIGFQSGSNIFTYDNISVYFNSLVLYKNCLLTIRASSSGNYLMLSESKDSNSLYDKYYAALLKFSPQLEDSFNLSTKNKIIERLDTFNLGMKKYANTLHVSCEITNCNTNNLSGQGYEAINEFWISKQAGIIKKIIRNPIDTAVWELQRFQISN